MSIKALIVGNFLEQSGWSKQCENLILALDTIQGVEVVCRNINILNNRSQDVPERIKELTSRSSKNPDVVIQNVLPHMLEYNSRVAKNIAYYVCETSHFKNTSWAKQINMMSEAWVPCQFNREASLASNVRVNVHVVPEATDLSKYSKTYPVHRIREVFKDDYIFFTIGEFTSRKNLELIVKAFALEFHRDEPVQLFIKTNPSNVNIQEKLEQAKTELRIYGNISNYKKENVQQEFLSEEGICSIHQSCNCFISASKGEAFCIPAMDSLGFGNAVIAPRYGGFLDYLDDKNSWPLDGIIDNVWSCNDPGLPDIYTSDEKWYYSTISSMRQNMRSCFEKKDLVKRKIQAGKETVKKFSYENVGQIAEKFLVR